MCFTRNSVKRDRQILAEAYKYAVDNKGISLEEIDRALENNGKVFKIQVGSQRLCTTKLVHQEERRMVNLARNGVGKLRPLDSNFNKAHYWNLNKEQLSAFSHVMSSQDKVTMIRGAAGTGKTTLLKSVISRN